MAAAVRLVLLVSTAVLLDVIALERAGVLTDEQINIGKSWLVPGAMVVAALACSARALLVQRERWAWTLLAIGIGGYSAAQVYWVVWLEPLVEPPFPSLADGFWIALYPLGFVALVLIAHSRLRGFHVGIWLDGIVGGTALAALWQAVAFGPILAGGEGLGTLTRVTLLAYPFGDLLLIAVVMGVFALSEWSPGPSWLLLGGGFVLFAAADTVYNAMVAQGDLVASLALTGLWPLGMLAVALAAWMPAERRVARADGRRGLLVPSASTTLAVGVLVYGSFERVDGVATVLAASTIVAGIVRAYFTLRELRALSQSREEAITDYLTGLGNRRRLMRDLGKVFGRGETTVLALLDLDGFKSYNDRFGHVQGDLLLARLGDRLAQAVDGVGRAYRLGGDEFCVLVPGAEGADRASVIELALTESGRGFDIGCTSGWAVLPSEAENASEALRLADTRMYAKKNSRPGAAKRQAADVALGILALQQPGLERHVGMVAMLAVRVGEDLGMESSELDDLARAAELHDVGKIAIPSSILEKPGPLDDEEWEHVRRHTLVGERMLAAAPSLERVARIVRSTHERFDGAGYPDRLEGEEIPLAARIIAVCDAFDAMTSQRPYRGRRSVGAALAELARCSGKQFDPTVVRAFLALGIESHRTNTMLRAS